MMLVSELETINFDFGAFNHRNYGRKHIEETRFCCGSFATKELHNQRQATPAQVASGKLG